jgi:xylulose-5-phosphate/fructose-6-phosphate phosphoketolase
VALEPRTAGRVRQAGDPNKLIEHKEYIARYGDDLPEITDSRWGQEAASAAVRSTEADNV